MTKLCGTEPRVLEGGSGFKDEVLLPRLLLAPEGALGVRQASTVLFVILT